MTVASSLTQRAMDTDTELDELVRRSRHGDLAAFNAVVDRHYAVTFRLCFRLMEDREAAEDATQEIFVKAWRGIPRFRAASGFATWLYKIAMNHCFDAARRRRSDFIAPLPQIDGDDDGPQVAASPSLAWDLRLVMQEAVADLPEKLRIVVVMHYYSDHSVKEIAAMLGLPPTTVYSRLDRAVALLGRVVRDQENRE